jgi:hypothetical protein
MEYNVKSDKNEQIDKAMDNIRNKHGPQTITFATLIKKKKAASDDLNQTVFICNPGSMLI